MPDKTFTALLVEEQPDGSFVRRIAERSLADLPEDDLLLRVHYSSLNYKDALSATGNRGITRSYPHTPGIDAAGEVVECASGRFAQGEAVIVTSYDLGMNTPGGFGQYIRVPSEWALPLPEGLTLRQSMILGTAGLTAALSVHRLLTADVSPADGTVLVTGASGGVGSLAIAILARIGYRVAAATGKQQEAGFLLSLGAAEVLPRKEILDDSGKPLLPSRWAGAIDVAGGRTLDAVLKATRYGGAVTCCGLVDSAELETSIFPFILRGMRLLGVNSEQTPMPLRLATWQRLANSWKPSDLEALATEVPLADLDERIEAMLHGRLRGRTVIRLP